MIIESMLQYSSRVLDLQRSFRSIIGVKEVEKPAYHNKTDYERFNQMNWVGYAGRSNWDPIIKEIDKRAENNTKSFAKKGKSGYALIDRALADSAVTTASGHPHEEWRWPNVGFLSWSPLRKPTYEKLGVGRFDASDVRNTANLIKKVAIWSGASLAGVALLNRKWVYSRWYDSRTSPPRNPRIVFSDEPGFERYLRPTQLEDGTQIIPKEMKYVVSLACQEDYWSIRTAPSALVLANNARYGYSKVVQTVSTLAEFVRGLGFNAIPTVGDTCLKIPIAMDAGLGEDGRHCLLITPEFGPRIRMGALITDLPLATDKPITFGVHEFCEQCMKCAKMCPGKAIPEGPRTDGHEKNDVNAPTISNSLATSKWMLNPERCWAAQAIVGTCSVCRRVCPWNIPPGRWNTRLKWLAINKGSQGRRMLIELYEMLGYGKRIDASDWWVEAKQGSQACITF